MTTYMFILNETYNLARDLFIFSGLFVLYGLVRNPFTTLCLSTAPHVAAIGRAAGVMAEAAVVVKGCTPLP